jgi:putative NADPH-quinone reductase
MKKILIINGNPKPKSFCKSIAEHYAKLAKEKHDVRLIHIGDMNFGINLEQGYESQASLEVDVINFQTDIKWAEHIVIISPVWWGTMPAKFKGLIDRAFLPGFAFKYTKGKTIPQKLLTGRSSELFLTLDTPVFWYKYVQGNPIYKTLKYTILDFVGIKNQATLYFGPIINSQEVTRQRWLDKVSERVSKL